MSDIDDTELSQTSTAGMASSTGQPIDVEKSGSGPNGYLKLAKLMAVMPTMGMYRRFGVLNSLSLLFYQADLVKLERELLHQIQQDDTSADGNKRVFSKDWTAVSATDSQRKIVEQMRNVLEKYSKFLGHPCDGFAESRRQRYAPPTQACKNPQAQATRA